MNTRMRESEEDRGGWDGCPQRNDIELCMEKPAEEGPANASKEVRVTFRSHLTGRPGRLQPATPASENL